MLLDIREREREAQANRLAQAEARPVPIERVNQPAGFLGRAFGLVQPEPAYYEPPRPVARFNNGGDFDWIDNPSTYARCTTRFTIFV